MEPSTTNPPASPLPGNPLDATQPVGSPTQATSEPVQIHTVLDEAKPSEERPAVESVNIMTPPTPISPAAGSGEVVNPIAGMATAPQKSNTLGIVIGIMLLISIIVGASLYYYFSIYTKGSSQTTEPAPVTLITEPEVITEVPVEVPAIPQTPPVPTDAEISASLLTEIDSADTDLAVSDAAITNFDEQIK